MGQFSWLDCKTGEQVLDNVLRKVYVLIPQEFGGGHIEEECYDGYGHFGNLDIFDLIASWNRAFIPQMLTLVKEGTWTCRIPDEDKQKMLNYAFDNIITDKNFERRNIGIYMACYDEDNARLPYPIKITHDKDAVYEECDPSNEDPNQGWPTEDDEPDDDASYDDWRKTRLWDILKEHFGHRIEIAIYGDVENPANICLEDMDTNEVILDAGIYTITARENV